MVTWNGQQWDQCPRCRHYVATWELRASGGCNICAGQLELSLPEARQRCTRCQAELCPELDAYWGRDLVESGQCDPCRRGRRCL